jgi:hypothetical protein
MAQCGVATHDFSRFQVPITGYNLLSPPLLKSHLLGFLVQHTLLCLESVSGAWLSGFRMFAPIRFNMYASMRIHS